MPPVRPVQARATRRAVAAAAGVSEYTVSVVLNDAAYGRVSPRVREHVITVASQLGYQPQAAGRALRLGRTELLAYVTAPQLLHTVSSYHGALVPALLRAANAEGYDLAIIGDDSPENVVDRLRRALQAGKFDGIIVGRPLIEDPLIDLLRASGTPFVLAGSHPDETLHQVRRDDVGVARQMATMLLQRGHRRVGHSVERADTLAHGYARTRHDTLHAIVQANGGSVFDLPPELQQALAVVQQEQITAVVAEHAQLGAALLAAAQARAWRVPEQLAIGSLYCVQQPIPTIPTLASFCVDPSDAGRESARLLAAIIAGRPPTARAVVLESWFVAGESLGS